MRNYINPHPLTNPAAAVATSLPCWQEEVFGRRLDTDTALTRRCSR